jgi:HEAT repeat protein
VDPASAAAGEALLGALADPDVEVRRTTAESLGRLAPSRDRLPRLASALADPDDRVRSLVASAVVVLARTDPAAVHVLLAAAARAGESGWDITNALAPLLPEVLPHLREVLAGPDPALRVAVLDVLGHGEGEEVSSLLLSALDDPDYRVRRSALRALSSFVPQEEPGSGERLTKIAGRLADPDAGVRRWAGQVLRLKGEEACSAVEPYLASERLEVRVAAAAAGVECGLPRERILAVLREALGTPTADLRQQAAWILFDSEDVAQEATADLLARLDDPDPAVRDLAALALVRWGSTGARARAFVNAILADAKHPLHDAARFATSRR